MSKPSPTQDIAEEPPKKKRRRRWVECGVRGCQTVTGFRRQHLLEEHVPTIFDERLEVTQELCQRRFAALTLMARSILGPSRASLGRLVDTLNECQSVQPGEVSERQQEAMRQLCFSQGWDTPTEFTLAPINSAGALVHWRCLEALAGCLSQDVTVSLRETFQSGSFKTEMEQLDDKDPENEDVMYYLPVLHGFDAHFYLDRTRTMFGLSKEAGVDYLAEILNPEPPLDYHFQLSGCVAVYCDSSSYPEEELNQLVMAGTSVVVGAHPKTILSESQMEKFRRYS